MTELINENSPANWISRAERLQMNGHLEDAISCFRKALDGYKAENDLEGARQCLQQINQILKTGLKAHLASDPTSVPHLRTLIRLLHGNGDVSDYEKYCLQLVSHPECTAEDVLSWSNYLASTNRPGESIEALERVCSMEPENSSLMFGLANAQIGIDQNDKATETLQRIAPDAEEYADAQAFAAKLYLESGDLENAEQCANRAINKDAKLAGAYQTLYGVKLQQRKFHDGIDAYDRFFDLMAETDFGPWGRQKDARSRGIPAIYLISQPRSASEFVCDALSELLDAPTFPATTGPFPTNFFFPRVLNQIAKGGAILREHLDGSPKNLEALAAAGAQTLVVQVRDPRQSAVSWAHHIEDMKEADFAALRNRYRHVPPWELRGTPLETRLHWTLENYFPDSIEWLTTWLDAEHRNNGVPHVEFIQFEDYADDFSGYFQRLSKIYDIDLSGWREMETARTYSVQRNFRKGSKNEWREVIPSAVAENLWAQMEGRIADRFGWVA